MTRWISLVTDGLPGLALAGECAEPGVMRRPPRWQTIVFTVPTLCQLYHVLAIRTEPESVFAIDFPSNLRLLGTFIAIHPGIETSMQAHNRQTLVERFANNDYDLYLFPEVPEMEDVVAQQLLPNPLVVLARDDQPLADETNIAFARLATEPFLIREEGSGARCITKRLFREHGLSPKVRMELGTNEAIKEAILASLGVTIMSRHTFGQDPGSSRYRCLDVEGFPLENHWYFACPAGKQLSAAARAFLDFARAHAKAMGLDSVSPH